LGLCLLQAMASSHGGNTGVRQSGSFLTERCWCHHPAVSGPPQWLPTCLLASSFSPLPTQRPGNFQNVDPSLQKKLTSKPASQPPSTQPPLYNLPPVQTGPHSLSSLIPAVSLSGNHSTFPVLPLTPYPCWHSAIHSQNNQGQSPDLLQVK
jgi:hypothetical protein